MSGRIMLEVVTPTKTELKVEVEYIVAPTINGVVGILPGHIRLITELTTGVLRYKIDGKDHYMAVSQGFMEVTPFKVIVLAEAAEMGEKIDPQKALDEKRAAEDEVRRSLGAPNLPQLEIALERAEAKVEAAKKYDHK